jgi:hypothetical protein
MKMQRTFSIALASIVMLALLITAVLAGTATTNEATAAAGDDCARIDAKGTGAMTVSEVRVNGVAKTTGFTVVRSGSSQVVIQFNPTLNAGDRVQVFLTTANKGTFEATLKLSKSGGRGC